MSIESEELLHDEIARLKKEKGEYGYSQESMDALTKERDGLKAENEKLKGGLVNLQVEYTSVVGRHSRKNMAKLRVCQNYPPYEPFYNACLSCVMLDFCRMLFKE